MQLINHIFQHILIFIIIDACCLDVFVVYESFNRSNINAIG